jgi:signal transduction histidine kinase
VVSSGISGCILVFKESLNNALRRSDCRSIRVTLRTMARAIELAVADDSRGFDPDRAREGNGLASMRTRAQSVVGGLVLRCYPGDGTEIRFTTPL